MHYLIYWTDRHITAKYAFQKQELTTWKAIKNMKISKRAKLSTESYDQQKSLTQYEPSGNALYIMTLVMFVKKNSSPRMLKLNLASAPS